MRGIQNVGKVSMKLRILAFLGFLWITPVIAQSSPGLIFGQVPTAPQWNSYFSAKQDLIGFTPVNKAGDVMLGELSTIASTTASTGFHITAGVAPTSPNVGDIWTTSTGLFAYLGGVTQQVLMSPLLASQLPSALIATSELDVDSNSAAIATLYSTGVYGTPNTGQGFFASAGSTLNARIYSSIYAEAALYAATTRSYLFGEVGLQIFFTSATGYIAPGTSGIQDKAGLQISAFGQPGGGETWGAAISTTYASGWAGSGGNFGVGLEIDPTNNAAAAAIGNTTSIFGLWLAGAIGSFPITSYLQISPYATNGSNYAANVGILFTGAHTILSQSINDGTSSATGYFDNGTHSIAFINHIGTAGTGASFTGTYTADGLDIIPTAVGSGYSALRVTETTAGRFSIVSSGAVNFLNTSGGTATGYVCHDSVHNWFEQVAAC